MYTNLNTSYPYVLVDEKTRQVYLFNTYRELEGFVTSCHLKPEEYTALAKITVNPFQAGCPLCES